MDKQIIAFFRIMDINLMPKIIHQYEFGMILGQNIMVVQIFQVYED